MKQRPFLALWTVAVIATVAAWGSHNSTVFSPAGRPSKARVRAASPVSPPWGSISAPPSPQPRANSRPST